MGKRKCKMGVHRSASFSRSIIQADIYSSHLDLRLSPSSSRLNCGSSRTHSRKSISKFLRICGVIFLDLGKASSLNFLRSAVARFLVNKALKCCMISVNVMASPLSFPKNSTSRLRCGGRDMEKSISISASVGCFCCPKTFAYSLKSFVKMPQSSSFPENFGGDNPLKMAC